MMRFICDVVVDAATALAALILIVLLLGQI